MMRIGAPVLFLALAAPAAWAEPQPPVELARVEGRYLSGIADQVEELGRLRADAMRRNDGIAASCVEQRLAPAQTLKAAAAKAASRLRALEAGDIEAVNGEVRNLSSAATRVGELTTEARSCLRINSGQIVRNVQLTPDTGYAPARAKDEEHLADLIVPRRPAATPIE